MLPSYHDRYLLVLYKAAAVVFNNIKSMLGISERKLQIAAVINFNIAQVLVLVRRIGFNPIGLAPNGAAAESCSGPIGDGSVKGSTE